MASAASLLVLSLPFYGIQSVWSTEMAFAPPYLLSLGIPRDLMSLVLLAAPLSGLFVQPLIGHHADHSKSKYGRRRPYMFVGTIVGGLAMFWLGYGKPVFEAIFGVDSNVGKGFIIAVAVVSVYVVDFSVNAIMAVDRALLVDVLPAGQQEQANAWGARMVQLSSIVGYWIGSIDLPGLLPWLGTSQIQVLSGITIVSLVIPHALAILHVKETPTSQHAAEQDTNPSILGMMGRLWTTIRSLPDIAHLTFHIQFWSWLSQFPALIYTTVYIGDIFRSTHQGSDTDAATRAGSRAMFYEALVGMIAIIIVPALLEAKRWGPRAIWGKRSPPRVFLSATWAASQLVSAFVMFCFSTSRSVHAATVFISLNGFCMTVNHWAPFALVGEAILLDARAKPPLRSGDDEDDLHATPEAPLLAGSVSPERPMSAGAAMGILNAFICIPQFLVIALSSLLFAILEPHRTIGAHDADPTSDLSFQDGEAKDQRSITLIIVFRLAAVSGLIAFYLAIKLTKHLQSQASIYDEDSTVHRRDDEYHINA